MRGHKGYHHTNGTAEKIEAHMRKHRKAGGKAESAMKGKDDAESDIKDKPERYNKSRVEDESEEMHAKKGGKMCKATGGAAVHNAGRKARASGGGCESNPFTSANKGTSPRDHKTEGETKGKDK